MYKMQVEEMRDFSSQKKMYEEISTILQARHPGVKGYSVKSIKRFCKKKQNGIFLRISQEHVRAMISEVVAEVQKNFYKIYFFE